MTVAVIAALLAAAAPRALPAARPALVVSVEQETVEPLDANALRALDREVGRVWRPYADVTVRDAASAQAVAADDLLTLVITDRFSDIADGLGWIEFVNGQPSHTIYVSRARADRLAQQGTWAGRAITEWPPKMRELFLLRAVATAVAHEVGHYLLRSKAHAASGLMRTRFTVDDLMSPSPATYRLDRAETLVLQQRARGSLLARGRAPDTPMP